MYRKFLNARSPLRLLEKGLHGGLGRGNLGLVLAGHGVGKTAFLVGVAMDDLLRGSHVLHVSLDQTVSHVRTFYDTVFEDLAASTHLEDEARAHADIDRLRSIRAYPPTDFDSAKLREAIRIEAETEGKPELIVLEGYDLAAAPRDEVEAMRGIAVELGAEFWFSVTAPEEHVGVLSPELSEKLDLVSVVLALEPGPEAVALRCLKDHESPDPSALHVHLDPKTLLLARG